MKWRVKSIIMFSLAMVIYACRDNGFTRTSSGLRYKIVRNGNGPTFKKGDYVVFNMEYYDDNDSLLYSSLVRNLPVTMLFNDSLWNSSGQAYEGLGKMKVGDSAIFKVKCNDLYLKSFHIPVPSHLDPDETITFRVGASGVMNENEFKDYQNDLAKKRVKERVERDRKQLIEDQAMIDEYLEKKNIIPMETESGLRYLVEKPGKGPKPLKGDTVVINFTASLLDGTEFASSRKMGKPLKFPLGFGFEIKGLEEGIAMMSKGGKYKFFIPSALAFGDRSAGPIVGPNSILVYDTELVDFKK